MSTPLEILGLRLEPAEDAYHPGGHTAVRDHKQSGAPIVAQGSKPWCVRRRLELLKDRHGTGNLNVPLPTMGGKQVWADVMVYCGWRIQENIRYQRFRLLDPEDTRRAWGHWEGCRVALEEARLRHRLYPRGRHAVLLLHGLIRARSSMKPMAEALHQAGYEVINATYPSTKKPIEDHAQQISRLLERLEDVDTLSCVTHSLGGIVMRTLLAMDPETQHWRTRFKIGRLLMIFPPNQGALKADRWKSSALAKMVMGPSLQELTRQAAVDIPPPRGQFFSIIAGSRDTTVQPKEAILPGAEYIRVMNAEHTFGMQDPDIIKATVRYLNGGPLYDP